MKENEIEQQFFKCLGGCGQMLGEWHYRVPRRCEECSRTKLVDIEIDNEELRKKVRAFEEGLGFTPYIKRLSNAEFRVEYLESVFRETYKEAHQVLSGNWPMFSEGQNKESDALLLFFRFYNERIWPKPDAPSGAGEDK